MNGTMGATMYSPEAIRVKLVRRWWTVFYPCAFSPVAHAWLTFLAGKDDELSVMQGFIEIEDQCGMQFIFTTTKPCILQYNSVELAWTVRSDGGAGRSARFNLLNLHARRVSRSGHARPTGKHESMQPLKSG